MKARHLIAVLAPTLLVACGGNQSGTSKITVLLKDAPANLTAAVVTISEIDLVGSGGSIMLSPASVTTTVDLLSLANDTATLVKDTVIPTGTYSQLRFVITGGYIEVPQPGGGTIIYASSPTYEGLPEGAVVGGTLQMPSFAQSGLKVDLGGLNVGTAARVILVDFDVAQSFGHVAGGSGMWVMHPVCTATEVQLTGTVNVSLRLGSGVTLPGSSTLAQFSAVLTPSGGSPKALPLADAGGGNFAASFVFLFPGDYTLDFDPNGVVSSFTTTPPVPASVTVTSGQATAASFTVTAAH